MCNSPSRFLAIAAFVLVFCNGLIAQTDSDSPTALEDPVPEAMELGDIQVNLVKFVQAPESEDDSPPFGTNNAYARIQYLKSPPDESGRLFFNDTRGILYVTDEDGSEPTVYLDLRDMDVDFYPNVFPHESGFMSFAFHHEFAIEDSPGYGKFYTAFTADPESGTADYIEETDSAQESVIYEWTALDPTALEFFGSRREILRVGQFRPNHNIGNIAFNPFSLIEPEEDDDSDGGGGGDGIVNTDDEPGDEDTTETRHKDWGMLFISFGDGGGAHDPRSHGQNVATPLGAILRINPLVDDPEAEESYQIPPDNPEIEGAIPELWAYGLRHPQHFSWDTDGRMFILDIGQDQVEEVNLGSAGANYGWRQREGTFATAHGVDTNDGLGGVYEVDLEAEENDFVYPVAQYDHDEGFAIGSGFVYRGESVPELVGKYVFTELVRGRVFYIETEPEQTPDGDEESNQDEVDDVEDVLIPGEPTTIYELQMLFDGEESTMSDEAGMSNTYWHHSPHLRRVDLRISVDRHGEMYLLSKGDGWIRKIEQVPEDEEI